MSSLSDREDFERGYLFWMVDCLSFISSVILSSLTWRHTVMNRNVYVSHLTLTTVTDLQCSDFLSHWAMSKCYLYVHGCSMYPLILSLLFSSAVSPVCTVFFTLNAFLSALVVCFTIYVMWPISGEIDTYPCLISLLSVLHDSIIWLHFAIYVFRKM